VRRGLVILALLASAGIHAALTPEHLIEMPRLGVSFIAATAAALIVAAWVAFGGQGSRAFLAASLLFVGMIAAWALAVTAGIPILMHGAEPVEPVAVVCKVVELAGLAVLAVPSWRRMGALAVPAALLLAVVPGQLAAADSLPRAVDIPGKLFEPEQQDVLVGDTVTWRNLDAVTHTVIADDHSFDSGDLPPDGVFSITLDHPGSVAYHCEIHRFMTGEIDVFALALSGPADPVTIGTQFVLRGLAAPGTELVAVERRDSTGKFVHVATASATADGRFTLSLPAVTSSDYRALVGALSSRVVPVAVSPRVALRVRRVGQRVRLEGAASPPQPGAAAVLQLYSRERFDWLRFARGRLDAESRISIGLSPRRTLQLRLVLVGGSAGLVGGTSNAVLVAPRGR